MQNRQIQSFETEIPYIYMPISTFEVTTTGGGRIGVPIIILFMMVGASGARAATAVVIRQRN